jgi:hypothetical protein
MSHAYVEAVKNLNFVLEGFLYRFAYKYSEEVIFYFDSAGNKYVATGGNLAWRINNPGLVSSHSHFSRANGAIGSCGRYAIFSDPLDGRKALFAWIHSKKYYNSSIKTLADYYQPKSADRFIAQLTSLAKISPDKKINSFTKSELDHLIKALEKLCAYEPVGNESLSLLPKITAKIENGKDKEDMYLVGDNIVISKKEAIEWIMSHCLDGVIVHERSGAIHLRSRPSHCIWNIKAYEFALAPSEGKIDPLVRVIGKNRPGQCIWAFINGIDNTKDEALEAAERISNMTKGEQVLSMPNDTIWWPIDFLLCIILKTSADTSIITWTIKFLRYLLTLAKQMADSPPVIVFLHSQGAIFIEHAIDLLSQSERKRLRIFTFGGGSFIPPGKCHPDSHNYASAADFVCRFSSPNLQLLALERYYGYKEGLNDEKIIARLAFKDAIFHLDSNNLKVMEHYIKQRTTHYENEFSKISNLTILDPDPDFKFKHKLDSDCYQKMIQNIIKKYQKAID